MILEAFWKEPLSGKKVLKEAPFKVMGGWAGWLCMGGEDIRRFINAFIIFICHFSTTTKFSPWFT